MRSTPRAGWSPLAVGVWLSVASIVWTICASASSVAVGLLSSNLVLVAFGCTGLLDAAGSTALVVHFRHAMRHDTFSERHEQVALSIVTIGLLVVASLTAVESIRRLLLRVHGRETPTGIAIAAASMLVLGWLSHRKRSVGMAIPSHALVADGWLSLTGALLALVTVAGTLLSRLGWWWADPGAALVVAVGALVIGIILRRGERDEPEPASG
jgi:divalent metal cation (Fe/Co/Zn/Cd) transporter